MDDLQGVDFVNCLANLLHDGCQFGLCYWFRPLKLMLQLPSSAYLQYNVNVSLIVEVAVHLDDIGMVQKLLNLELSGELLNNFLLYNNLLLDHLQGANEA